MRAAKVLAVLAIAALGIGSFSAVAVAGKSLKNKVKVDYAQNPTIDKSGLVIAQVALFQRGAIGPCWEGRSLRLQVLNRKGVVLTTLDRTRTDAEGPWTLSGQLPTTLPAGTNYVRVKMKKRIVGKVVCQAGVSPTVDPSNGEIVAPASPK